MNEEEMKSAPGDIYGKSLKGLGLNLLVRDIARSCEFLKDICEMQIVRADKSFAIIKYADQYFMLHVDGSYAENPLLSLLPESGARGAGIELRLYHTDPDKAEARANSLSDKHNCSVLRTCSDRPHGLRECYILDENGYCFVPSRHLSN